ncbi:MAG: hypothetical protein KJO69_11560, partial [Gammaproteobacteria bacterium]|nr:hypothetical protein [Gammaproteobacteria bacterium]
TDLKVNYELKFQDGNSHHVRVIGNNSEYVFYVYPGNPTVSISPIKDTITSMRKLSKEEQEQLIPDSD